MNLRDWARATHRVMTNLPVELHYNDLSMADIERVLRTSLTALIDSLADGDDLSLDDLGRLWIEEKQGYIMVSNLGNKAQRIEIPNKRVIHFRASRRLLDHLNKPE